MASRSRKGSRFIPETSANDHGSQNSQRRDKPKGSGPLRPMHPADYLAAERRRVLAEAKQDNLGALKQEYLRKADNLICYVFERGFKYVPLPANADVQEREPYHHNHEPRRK